MTTMTNDGARIAEEMEASMKKVAWSASLPWIVAFLAMCVAGGAREWTIAMQNRSIDNLQRTVNIQLKELNLLKLQIDVQRRAELDRQMNWRKNFIPHEVRELFDRDA